MGFKEISPLEAMNALADGRPVYRFSQMSQELLAKTSVSGFLNLRFAVEGDYHAGGRYGRIGTNPKGKTDGKKTCYKN